MAKEKVQKYIRLPNNEIVIFSTKLEHKIFEHLKPVSAGFCYIDIPNNKVQCFGESLSLELKCDDLVDWKICTEKLLKEVGCVVNGL